MKKNSVKSKKRSNKTKRPNRIRRSHGSSTRRTRVKRGGMYRTAIARVARAASPQTLNSNAFKTIQEARTFFYHSIAPLFTRYEYHVAPNQPNPEDKQLVKYGERHYNSPLPKELTDEFNVLQSVIQKTKADETDPVQISGRLFDLYTKVKTILDEQQKKSDDKENIAPPIRSLSAPATFTSQVQNSSPYILQTKTPSTNDNTPLTSGNIDTSILHQFIVPPYTTSPNPSKYTHYSTATISPPKLPSKTITQLDFSQSPLPTAVLFNENNDDTPQSSPLPYATPQSINKSRKENNPLYSTPIRPLNLEE